MTCTNRKNCLYLSRRDIDVHDPRVDQPTWIYLCTIELFLEENRGGGGRALVRRPVRFRNVRQQAKTLVHQPSRITRMANDGAQLILGICRAFCL